MALLVESVATKPVTSDLIELLRVSDVRWRQVRGALLLKLDDCGRVCCLNAVAVPLGAEHLCVRAVVVCETVRCGRPLAVQLELAEDIRRYSYPSVSPTEQIAKTIDYTHLSSQTPQEQQRQCRLWQKAKHPIS